MEETNGAGLQLLTPQQVGERTGYSRRQVHRWIAAGELRAVRTGRGGGWRVDEHDLEAFVATWETNEPRERRWRRLRAM